MVGSFSHMYMHPFDVMPLTREKIKRKVYKQWTLFITRSRLLFYFVFRSHLIFFHTTYRLQMALGV